MDASPLNNQIKGFLMMAACLLLAIVLGYTVGTESYLTLLMAVVSVLVCWLWFFSGRFFWVLTIASSFLGGTFPILQGQFTPFQILMAMGLVKFLIEDVILRRTRLKMPDRFDFLMIAGFMSVIVFHAFKDRLGMKFLGSDVWGGRHYVNVFVGLAAFFVMQSIPMKPGFWAKFPYVVLAISGFDLFIAVITTIAPGLIYVIYPFYSAVSTSSFLEATSGELDVTGRIGAFGNFGFIIIAIVFATISLRAIFHPSNFFRLIAVFLGGLGVLASGYRTSILQTTLLFLTAGIRDLKAAAILLLPAFAALFFVFSVVNSEIVRLPKQVQRGLAFLPGHWDSDMANDVAGSNDFRISTWTLWAREYFPKHPIVGRGFGFKSEWTKKMTYMGRVFDYQQIVETGNIHNGLLAAVDTFGLLGTLFFVSWNIRLLVSAFRVPFDRRRGDYFALRFLALYLAVSILFYCIGAYSVGTFLPQQFALAGLFLRLRRDLKLTEEAKRPAAPARPRQFQRELART